MCLLLSANVARMTLLGAAYGRTRQRVTSILQHGAWHLQFYQTENRDGVLRQVRKSVKLHDKDREHNSATCKAVKALRDTELAKVSTGPQITKRRSTHR